MASIGPLVPLPFAEFGRSGKNLNHFLWPVLESSLATHENIAKIVYWFYAIITPSICFVLFLLRLRQSKSLVFPNKNLLQSLCPTVPSLTLLSILLNRRNHQRN